MALLVFYSQIGEDPIEIEYRFGTTEENLDQLLIINKETRQFRDQEGGSEGITRATAARILGRFRKDGHWPKGGIIQS